MNGTVLFKFWIKAITKVPSKCGNCHFYNYWPFLADYSEVATQGRIIDIGLSDHQSIYTRKTSKIYTAQGRFLGLREEYISK